jgi:hypothetical protein
MLKTGKRLIIIASIIIGFALPKEILAQSKMVSPNYEIQFPNFNAGAGVPKSTNFWTRGTLGQTAPGLFSSANYRVRSGFQYISTIIPFSFSISNISINFGTLTPSTPDTRTATLKVKAGGAGGYSVKAIENHPLQITGSATTIPNTTCDTGTCTKLTAGVWSLNSTYGFGFNMSGDDVPSDFVNSNYFRPFANAALGEDPAIIMTKNQVTWNYPNNTWPWESQATITYKINVSPTQPAGTYTNIIKFTAIPAF